MRASNSCLVFTFSLYTSLFIHPHKPKSKEVRSGDLGGQWTGPPRPIHRLYELFLLRIIDNTTSQNIYYSSWNTLYTSYSYSSREYFSPISVVFTHGRQGSHEGHNHHFAKKLCLVRNISRGLPVT
jgi:hypothetical protein